ncbi:MAG TPA: hypothetical protein VMD27_04235 [Candidatus Aquilonibacter sp.]|nr:hypothetical protein [Candidatus Aquilonibacter sp.]
MMTSHEFYNEICTIQDIRSGSVLEKRMKEFIQKSPAKDLEELLLLSLHVGTSYNMHWIEQVKISLRLRIAEEAAQSADTLIEHTKQLTKQTDKNILLTETLTHQNEILVNESQKLGHVTWGLFYLTIILALLTAALLFIDWKKEKSTAENKTVQTQTGK